MPTKLLMPKELTAENGAKNLLSGEFYETLWVTCVECVDTGAEDDCPICDGAGELEQKIPVTWTTIKEIYARLVNAFGLSVDPDQYPYNNAIVIKCIPDEKNQKMDKVVSIQCDDPNIESEMQKLAAALITSFTRS